MADYLLEVLEASHLGKNKSDIHFSSSRKTPSTFDEDALLFRLSRRRDNWYYIFIDQNGCRQSPSAAAAISFVPLQYDESSRHTYKGWYPSAAAASAAA